ncbi:MAG: M48 family metallopeptidase [Halococcoides sp.]
MARLRRRMAITLLALGTVDFAVAVVLAVLAVPWVRPIAGAFAGAIGVGVSGPALVIVLVVAVAVGLAALELAVARRRLVDSVAATPATDETHPDLLDRVRRLAAQADVPVPEVAVVDRSVPNSALVGGPRGATLLVSRGLLETLDGDELDAVLAHELAHRQNRDAVVMTVAGFLPAVIDDRSILFEDWSGWRPRLVGSVVAIALAALAISGPLGRTIAGTVVVLAVVTFVIGSALLGVLAVPMTVLARRLARDREFAADRAGALSCGDPAALASALRRLDAAGPDRPTADRRADGVGGLCLLAHGFDPDPPAGFTIQTRSHPPIDDRIDRLRELTATLERDGVDAAGPDAPV